MDVQQPYTAPQPPFPAQASASAPMNPLAIASLVLGVATFVLVLGPLGSVPAIITGYIARRQIEASGERGADLAFWGTLLGYIGLGITAVLLVGALLIGLAFAAIHH